MSFQLRLGTVIVMPDPYLVITERAQDTNPGDEGHDKTPIVVLLRHNRNGTYRFADPDHHTSGIVMFTPRFRAGDHLKVDWVLPHDPPKRGVRCARAVRIEN